MVLKSLILVLVPRSKDPQTLFSWWKAALVLPIRSLTSASVPAFLSTMLPRYVKLSISPGASPSSVMRVSLTALTSRILLLHLWMFSKRAEGTATALVVSCICCWVCKRRARSSVKSMSSNCVQKVHWIPFGLWAVDFFMIKSIVRRNKKGDSKNPCLTPVRNVLQRRQ